MGLTDGLTSLNPLKNPLTNPIEAGRNIYSSISGGPPQDPNTTPAGKSAAGLEGQIIGEAGNITPSPTPTSGTDPAAQAKVDAAQQKYDAAVAAAKARVSTTSVAATSDPSRPLTAGGATGNAVPVPQSDAGIAASVASDPAVKAAQAELDAAKAAAATSIDPRLLTSPTTIAAPPPVVATTYNPGDLPAAPVTQVAQMPGSVPIADTNHVTGAQVGPSTGVSVGSASGAGVTATTIDPTNLKINPGDVPDIDISGTVGRQAQLQALALDQTAATGSAPSAAQILMQQGIDSSVGSAYGLAASLQGRNPGEALRQGVTTAADLQAKSVAQSAALRATEMATARGQYGDLASAVTGGDIQVAQSNQTKNLQVAITNLNDKIDVLKANQTAQLQAGIASAANATAASIATLQAQKDAAIASMQDSTTRDIANQTSANNAAFQNQADDLARQKQNQDDQTRHLEDQLKAQQDANDQTSANQTQVLLEQSREKAKALSDNQQALLTASQSNATNQTTTNVTQAQLNQATGQFDASQIRGIEQGNQAATLTEQQLNQSFQLGLQGLALNAASLGVKTAADAAAAKAAYDAGYAQFIVGAGKVIAGYGGGKTTSPTISGGNPDPTGDGTIPPSF